MKAILFKTFLIWPTSVMLAGLVHRVRLTINKSWVQLLVESEVAIKWLLLGWLTVLHFPFFPLYRL